ncbi:MULTISPECIES: hypothetical protein [Streptomyces]|uniref:Uncharacterized protein n=1 Tax=Streptomyces ramulosus TaxID=47762 RepID=A0ABW1FB16_9ACTN
MLTFLMVRQEILFVVVSLPGGWSALVALLGVIGGNPGFPGGGRLWVFRG